MEVICKSGPWCWASNYVESKDEPSHYRPIVVERQQTGRPPLKGGYDSGVAYGHMSVSVNPKTVVTISEVTPLFSFIIY